MTENEKNDIFNKFKQRNEREIIVNQGTPIQFGDKEINLKALSWNESNRFEDKIAEVLLGFKTLLSEKQIETNLEEIVTKILSLLREDLVVLANIATNGEVTIESIIVNNATKNDLMKIVIEAFGVNYSYAKNLIALSSMKMK